MNASVNPASGEIIRPAIRQAWRRRIERLTFDQRERLKVLLADASVKARPKPTPEVELTAYVVLASPSGLTAQALKEFLRERLPDYMIPARMQFLGHLPRTTTGKVDRTALASVPAESVETPSAADSPPAQGTEARLAELWQSVLNTGEVAPHDSFFDRGGHSLLAIQLCARVREAFAVELPLRAVFETPELAGMAGRIDEFRKAAGPLPETRIPRLPRPSP